MILEAFAWVFGALSAFIFAWMALRASLLYGQAQRKEEQAEKSSPSQQKAAQFFADYARRLRVEAGWRPRDHRLIVAAVIALGISQASSGIALFFF